MFVRSARRISLATLTAVLTGLLLVPSAFAAGPEQFGPYTWDDSIDIPDFCGKEGALVHLDTYGWEAFTVWTDDAGEITKILYRVRAPYDTFTDVATGRQVVNRGEFQEIIERIPGTDEFTKSISGFRYLIGEPNSRVEIRDVGRIVYGDLDQTIALWQAGKHDLVYFPDDFWRLCEAVLGPA